jgi:hypothetical protein
MDCTLLADGHGKAVEFEAGKRVDLTASVAMQFLLREF